MPRRRRASSRVRPARLVVAGRFNNRGVGTHTYSDVLKIVGATAPTAYKTFLANSMARISPDQSTTTGNGDNADALITNDRSVTGQPRGFDEMKAVYSQYRVVTSSLNMSLTSTAQLAPVVIWGYLQTSHGTQYTRPTNIDEVMSSTIPGFKRRTVQNRYSRAPTTLRFAFNQRNLLRATRYNMIRSDAPSTRPWWEAQAVTASGGQTASFETGGITAIDLVEGALWITGVTALTPGDNLDEAVLVYSMRMSAVYSERKTTVEVAMDDANEDDA